jgi:hypothetical protein
MGIGKASGKLFWLHIDGKTICCAIYPIFVNQKPSILFLNDIELWSKQSIRCIRNVV